MVKILHPSNPFIRVSFLSLGCNFLFTTGPIYKGSATVTAESEVSSGPESPKKRTSKLLPSFKIPAFKRNKGIRLVVLPFQLYVFLFLQTSLKQCVLVCLLFSTVLHRF